MLQTEQSFTRYKTTKPMYLTVSQWSRHSQDFYIDGQFILRIQIKYSGRSALETYLGKASCITAYLRFKNMNKE
jgi:hypothetical protein